MSFVINTTIDKNKEFLDALRNSLDNDLEKDVNFICKNNVKVSINSYVLALASDFFNELLKDIVDRRDTVNIIIPDIHSDVLRKVFEYIYIGYVSLETRFMGDFIEACNFLHLKATISCEKKLVFDSPIATTSSSSSSSVPVTATISAAPQTIATMINEFETTTAVSTVEDSSQYVIKQQDETTGGQILEVYEISNIEDTDITYDETMEEEDEGCEEEHYELLNVIPESDQSPTISAQTSDSVDKVKREKRKRADLVEITGKTSTPKMTSKTVDETIMEQAINEILSNNSSFRVVSEKYHIPKTLLWRRAKKFGYVKTEKQKDDIRIVAIEAIKRGESLISLSKRYNIPISTLHREKLKLYEKGQLPENVNLKNRSRGEDYDERLKNAIAEILNGKSQNEIAKKYNIPKTTIWRIIKKMDPKAEPVGEPVTPNSEVVEQLVQMSKKRMVKEEVYDDEKM